MKWTAKGDAEGGGGGDERGYYPLGPDGASMLDDEKLLVLRSKYHESRSNPLREYLQ